jgi:hypothetical protein
MSLTAAPSTLPAEAQEAEGRRREAALRRLREVCAAEQRYAAVNLALIHADWIPRMRRAKLQELRLAATELAAQLEVRHERRAQDLRAQRAAAAAAGARLAAARGAHLQALGALLAAHDAHVAASLERHVASVAALQAQFVEEREQVCGAHAGHKQALLRGMAAMAAHHAQAEGATAARHAAALRELQETWDERSGVVRLVAEERRQALRAALAAEAAAFEGATAGNRARHAELAPAEAAAADQIESQAVRLRQLQAGVAEWRRRLADDAGRWRQEGAGARAAKGEALRRHAAAQRELAGARRAHEERLRATSSS